MDENTKSTTGIGNIGPLPSSLRGVIHDINNPLSSIIGNVQLLLMREAELDGRTADKLKRIEADAVKIDSILKALRQSITE